VSAARACTDAVLITVCAFASPRAADRELVRAKVGAERFYEVFVHTDPALCQERRPDADLSTFEPPTQPALEVSMDASRVEPAADAVLKMLAERGEIDLEG
jgi:adenylylsulfate kinase-like enzyme